MKKTKDLHSGEPTKPIGLSDQASAYWDRLLAELRASGIELTPGHRAWLEMAATIAEDILDAAKRVKKEGAYVEGKAGLVAHPATKRLDALRRDQIKILTMLGLRSAVASQGNDEEDSLDDQLNG